MKKKPHQSKSQIIKKNMYEKFKKECKKYFLYIHLYSFTYYYTDGFLKPCLNIGNLPVKF